MKKNIYFILLLFGIFQKILAQVGIATATVSDGVMLELGTNNKGILLPRIALTSKKSSAPLPANVPSGTMVYNTATVGTFPNLVAPGIYWWSSEDTQWTSLDTNLDTATMKYTNAASNTNYNSTSWQNLKLFGNMVINESVHIYSINTSAQTLTIKKPGLYSISTILSFNRLNSGNSSMVSLTARLYINGNPVGTEQVFSPERADSLANNGGLFSHSFTEFLVLNANDVLSVRIKRTSGTFSSGYGTSSVVFHQNGDSSISVTRIR